MKRCPKCKIEKSVEDFWKNQSHCRQCQRFHRVMNPGPSRDHSWASSIAKYGMTVESWHAMFAAQKGVCAICKQVDSTRIRLAVDHDHATGKVRGLLCRNCNVALGLFKDDPIRINEAAGYLAARNV